VVVSECAAELSLAAVAVRACENIIDRAQVEELEPLSSFDRATQLGGGQQGREVDEGAGEGSRRNSAVLGDVGWTQVANAMNVDAGTLARSGPLGG
jgi:hypothetical protein